MQLLFSEIPAALTNTRAILERCNVELDFAQYRFPDFGPPDGQDTDSYLNMLCEEAPVQKVRFDIC